MAMSDGERPTFHHITGDRECTCPIHRNRERDPFTAPLGLPFADHVHVAPITRERAADIYDAHHSYMDSCPAVNLAHHGLYYQGELMGAITWRFPLISRKAVRVTDDGDPVPAPIDIDALPDPIQPTARRILPPAATADTPQGDRQVFTGTAFVEAARICLGVRMPNLASAALARSQERVVHDVLPEQDADVDFLLTFVRADYDAAMIRALRDKGWTCVGASPPSQASNRDETAIRNRWKWQFLCPIADVPPPTRQAALDQFATPAATATSGGDAGE